MPVGVPALLSLLAIVAAIVLSFKRDINTGLIALAFALPLGQVVGGMTAREIIVLWPVNLFVTLTGVTLLFAIAKVNETLNLLARHAVSLVGGRARLVPWTFFLLAAFLAAIGPGNIAVCALLGPIAMAIAAELNIPYLLMSAFLVAGSNAGGLSPFAPTGIIGNTLASEVLGFEVSSYIWLSNALVSFCWVCLLFPLLGGLKLNATRSVTREALPAFNKHQQRTLAAIVALVLGVMGFRLDVGLTAFSFAALLLLTKAAPERASIANIPWSTLLLVSGTAILIEICAHLGGIRLLTEALGQLINSATAAPLYALIAGVITFFASASGVTMPMLIRTLPELIENISGLSGTILTGAIIYGAHLVTNGPFTTLGALMAASLPDPNERQEFFRRQLWLGLAGLPAAVVLAVLIAYLLPIF